jgi:general secretion pathway protein J
MNPDTMNHEMGRRDGFTLIEVMVSLAVLALLVTLVQGVYSTSLRNREAAESATLATHSAAVVTGRIADELAMAFHSTIRPDETRFLLDTSPDGFSAIEFSSRTPSIADIRPGGDTRILYQAVTDPESREGRLILRRTELGDPYGDLERDGFTFSMMEELSGFSIQCYDGEEWVESWGNSDSEAPDLPLMVRIVMSWGDEENLSYIRTATSVYASSRDTEEGR